MPSWYNGLDYNWWMAGLDCARTFHLLISYICFRRHFKVQLGTRNILCQKQTYHWLKRINISLRCPLNSIFSKHFQYIAVYFSFIVGYITPGKKEVTDKVQQFPRAISTFICLVLTNTVQYFTP